MLIETIILFFKNPLHLNALIISWALSLTSFLYWREHPKARFLYLHLFFLLLPLLDFAVEVPCQMPFVQGLLTFCSVTVTRLIIYLVPVAIIFAVGLGYYAAPALYKRMYGAKPLIDKRFAKLALGVSFWTIDTAKPIAFSFAKDVLISVGMFELLNKKEQEAVVLHELGHIKNKSSLAKFSTWLARLFSPVAHFASLGASISAEEEIADSFAISMQGTARHLNSAKRKVEAFARL